MSSPPALNKLSGLVTGLAGPIKAIILHVTSFLANIGVPTEEVLTFVENLLQRMGLQGMSSQTSQEEAQRGAGEFVETPPQWLSEFTTGLPEPMKTITLHLAPFLAGFGVPEKEIRTHLDNFIKSVAR